MGLKILHTADLHLDSPFGGFSDEQRQLLKQQQKLLPGKIADLCQREGCDLMLLAGDPALLAALGPGDILTPHPGEAAALLEQIDRSQLVYPEKGVEYDKTGNYRRHGC